MTLNRRTLIQATAAGLASTVLFKSAEAQQTSLEVADDANAYKLPPLPYDYAALEPIIDKETMMLHHDKHHAAYIAALNKALANRPDLQKKTIEELLRQINLLPDDIRETVRNNGGGHANHDMFWKLMTPGGASMPDALKTQIDKDFGSVDKMKTAFQDAGVKQFGSGWAFLVYDSKADKLEILTMPNQDSILFLDGKAPILGNDLWEHAYYLKYHNVRADYLKAWWGVVNWPYAQERLVAVKNNKT